MNWVNEDHKGVHVLTDSNDADSVSPYYVHVSWYPYNDQCYIYNKRNYKTIESACRAIDRMLKKGYTVHGGALYES